MKSPLLLPYFFKKIFIITLIIGVIAYGFIVNLGFSFTDELCALLFLIMRISSWLSDSKIKN